MYLKYTKLNYHNTIRVNINIYTYKTKNYLRK